MSAVAIATPGITLPFFSRVFPMAPAMPPKSAIRTSQMVGLVRAIISAVGVSIGVIRKYTVELIRLITT